MSLGHNLLACAIGIAEVMPCRRASYEADATTPRAEPPTATGLPRRRASAACSTEAKNASASRWSIMVFK
ncbi:MAG: hypothetical protein EBY32_16305 [Proteobacteria bacterium]|nr:hypothetical protein [Pseudomonadota bacterium]